jgi:hypothetical protein
MAASSVGILVLVIIATFLALSERLQRAPSRDTTDER